MRCNKLRPPGFLPAVNTFPATSLPLFLPACPGGREGRDWRGWLDRGRARLGRWLRWLLPLPGEETAPAAADEGADEDAALIGRVATGDERALQQLFDKWKLPLLSFFYRSLGSHADAEDLTLEVFVRLHRAAPDYRPTAKFSTYLFHIAQNLLRNEYRRRRRKPAQPAPPELFDAVATETAEAGQRVAELEEMLQAALARLPEKPRTALLFVYQQNMDYRTAAAALHTNENALRVLVHRARQMLKSLLEAHP
jgi:RNA polymerase sigma-70 factor (ECF subfamily)